MKSITEAPKDLKLFPKKLRKAVTRAFGKTGIQGEEAAKKNAQRRSFDTGAFHRSIEHEIEQLPQSVLLSVHSDLEYAQFIEEGREPGKFPNLDALVGWTGRKLKSQGINTVTQSSFDNLKQLAKNATGQKKAAFRQHLAFIYLVGRKIATKGIEEKRIFADIERALRRFFLQELSKEIRAIL